jgi:hypothetical protein
LASRNVAPARQRDPTAVVRQGRDRLTDAHGKLGVLDLADRSRRLQHPLELTAEGVENPIAPQERQQLMRILFAYGSQASDQGFTRKALALLDVAEHHRIDAAPERFGGEAAQGEVASHQSRVS